MHSSYKKHILHEVLHLYFTIPEHVFQGRYMHVFIGALKSGRLYSCKSRVTYDSQP